MDQDKIKARGRPGDGIVREEHRHSFIQAVAPSISEGCEGGIEHAISEVCPPNN